jgi:hypothetical protein
MATLSDHWRHAGMKDDDIVMPGLAWAALLIAPLVWSLLGWILTIVGMSHGISDLIEGALEFWIEGPEFLQRLREGTYAAELMNLYGLAVKVGGAVLALTVLVAFLAWASTAVPEDGRAAVEAVAVTVWAVPFGLYLLVLVLIMLIVGLGLLIGYIIGVVHTLLNDGIIAAVLGALFVGGILVAGFGAVIVGFVVAYGPLFLLLRYAAPVGLVLAKPGGTANRWLRRSFAKYFSLAAESVTLESKGANPA